MQPQMDANERKWSDREAAPFNPAEDRLGTPISQRNPRNLWLIGICGFYVVEPGPSVIDYTSQTVFLWPGEHRKFSMHLA